MLTIHNRDKIINQCIKGIHTTTKKSLNYDIHIMIEDVDVYRIKLRDPFLGIDKGLALNRKATKIYSYSKEEYYMLEDTQTNKTMYVIKENIKDMNKFVHTELKFFIENI